MVTASIIVLVLVIALFIKKEYLIELEITINRPKTEIFEYIKYLKNQENYSVWASMDPEMKSEFRGTDGTAGFVSAWESKIDDGNRIDYEIRFTEPFENTGNTYLITEITKDSTTKVRWGYTGKMKYPWNFMALFMNMEEMPSPDLEKGLNNLKTLLEN